MWTTLIARQTLLVNVDAVYLAETVKMTLTVLRSLFASQILVLREDVEIVSSVGSALSVSMVDVSRPQSVGLTAIVLLGRDALVNAVFSPEIAALM